MWKKQKWPKLTTMPTLISMYWGKPQTYKIGQPPCRPIMKTSAFGNKRLIWRYRHLSDVCTIPKLRINLTWFTRSGGEILFLCTIFRLPWQHACWVFVEGKRVSNIITLTCGSYHLIPEGGPPSSSMQKFDGVFRIFCPFSPVIFCLLKCAILWFAVAAFFYSFLCSKLWNKQNVPRSCNRLRKKHLL